MTPALTLVIAVYNGVRNLEFILAALRRQSFTDFEVIVADDGSGPDIGALLEKSAGACRFPIRHLWQEDRGFRKNAMLNKAILAARTEYIVFVDGDCLPHRDFLRDHQENRVPGALLCGRRVNWSKEITEALTLPDVESGACERITVRLLVDGLMARSANLEDGVRIPSPFVRKMMHRNQARILGCNFSVAKGLLEQVNGFDEAYRAPGLGEDSDIAYRLELSGAKLLTLRYLAILYHLHHPATRVGEGNKNLFEAMLLRRSPWCVMGMQKPARGPESAITTL